MKYPTVYVITLSYNKKEDTIECIKSLQKMTYPNYEILIVENGSTDDSVIAIKEHFPEISLIEIKKNVGYSRGFNTGIEFAYEEGADYFLIMNNDTVIAPDALDEMVKVAQQDERIGFVSGKVYSYKNPNTLQRAGGTSGDPTTIVGRYVGVGEVDCGQHNAVQDCDFVDDVFLLVRRDVYERVGGYDTSFFLYFEETDWCARVRKAGFRILYTPEAKIWHKGNIDGSGHLSPNQLYYLRRNEMVFLRKNALPAQFRRYLPWSLWKLAIDVARLVRRGHVQYAAACLRGYASGFLWLHRNRNITRPNNLLQ